MTQDDKDDANGSGVPAADPASVEALARAAIARLVAETARAAGQRAAEPPEAVVEALCSLLLAGDQAGAQRLIRAQTENRQSYARIADGLLAAAARRLGRGWEEDRLSFAEVSVAIGHIFRLNQMFRQRHLPLRPPAGPRGVFATLPGQPHNLGLVLAAEAFRREGWEIELCLDAPAREIVEIARRLRPALVGLTLSRVDRRHQLAHLIESLRELPVPLRIMLGGRGATDMAALLPPGHVDRVVTDIASALREA